MRSRIKYALCSLPGEPVFDFYFGSYPGADGLYAGPDGAYLADNIAGFRQPIVNIDGTVGTITPFRIPATILDVTGKTVPLYPADIASVNHSHVAIARKIALDANGVARDAEYALTEEGVTLIDGKPSKAPTLERKQFGELVMAHVDCDTAPFLWRYADRFTLFDHFMDTIIRAIDAQCDCHDLRPGRRDAVDAASGPGGDGRQRQRRGCADDRRPRSLLGFCAGCGEPAESNRRRWKPAKSTSRKT